MDQSVEIVTGQSAGLPAGSYLDARLTGASAGIRLRALNADNREVAEPGQADGDVTVRPDPGAGPLRLVAAPSGGGDFAPGARIGVEVRGGAGAMAEGLQILVGQSDAGAYAQIELARFEYDKVDGWHVTAAGGRAATEFDFLNDNADAVTALDERQYPWVGPGRYALRRARAGSAASPSEQPWALVVDSSASMRPIFDDRALTTVVGLVAGIAAELTGRLPVAVGVTGRSRPEWFSAGIVDPQALVPEVLSTSRPASWSLLSPALAEAVDRGARTVVFLLDGAPADLEALPRVLEQRPGVSVLIVVAARPASEVSGQASTDQASALVPFDHVTHLQQLRVAYLPVDNGRMAIGAAAALAASLTGAAE